MKKTLLSIVILFAGIAVGTPALATGAAEISWDDLVPTEARFDDAFTRLDEEQLYELSLVAQVRDWRAAGEEVDEYTVNLYDETLKSLQEQEVDIDGLIAMRDQIAEERVAKTYLTNRELDGKPVRIPGYLLPLEFEGELVKEFLLVPYVGACIHTPPPPPNQIVHVVSAEGFTADGGLYTPVWVSGTMKTERGETDLEYVDGSAAIPSVYKLDATSVTVYED